VSGPLQASIAGAVPPKSPSEPGSTDRDVPRDASLQQAVEDLPSLRCGTSSPAHPKGTTFFQLRKLQQGKVAPGLEKVCAPEPFPRAGPSRG